MYSVLVYSMLLFVVSFRRRSSRSARPLQAYTVENEVHELVYSVAVALRTVDVPVVTSTVDTSGVWVEVTVLV